VNFGFSVRICSLYHIAVIGPIDLKSSFSIKKFFVFKDILTKLNMYINWSYAFLQKLVQIGPLYHKAAIGPIDLKPSFSIINYFIFGDIS